VKHNLPSLSLGLQKFYQPHLFFPNEKRMRDLVIYYLKGSRILDAGCGNGWLSICAWEEGFDVYSVDMAESEIKESQYILKQRNAFIRLIRTSLSALPFINSSFDSIICISVLEHISDIEQAILEIKRVLKKNGRLILVVPNGLTFGLFYDKFVYKLIATNTILSHVHKTLFSLSNHEISMLKLNEKEPVGHCQQFTLSGISKLLTKGGFKIINAVNCRFLSPYLRSLCTLLRREPITTIERLDNRIAEKMPPNLAAEWMIVCENLSRDL
jgi:2-polyprenyl-3-methyl-5-hydroxy-6-metoxy-1,4-benzoquinol methylase